MVDIGKYILYLSLGCYENLGVYKIIEEDDVYYKVDCDRKLNHRFLNVPAGGSLMHYCTRPVEQTIAFHSYIRKDDAAVVKIWEADAYKPNHIIRVDSVSNYKTKKPDDTYDLITEEEFELAIEVSRSIAEEFARRLWEGAREKDNITEINRVGSVIKNCRRKGTEFTEQEYYVAVEITRLCNNNKEAYLKGLKLVFSKLRAEAVLYKIVGAE